MCSTECNHLRSIILHFHNVYKVKLLLCNKQSLSWQQRHDSFKIRRKKKNMLACNQYMYRVINIDQYCSVKWPSYCITECNTNITQAMGHRFLLVIYWVQSSKIEGLTVIPWVINMFFSYIRVRTVLPSGVANPWNS